MKRAHRRTHLLLWLVLGPFMIAILYLSVQNRPNPPINDTLPEALIVEAS